MSPDRIATRGLRFVLVDLNHAGTPGLGEHPRASRHGRNVGLFFGPVRAASAALDIRAFVSTP